jgi:hypothetical protein
VTNPRPEVRLKYKPQGDTLLRFHQSKKPVRGVMGPLGSGKTSAFVLENLRLMESQAPGPDKVRRSRALVTRNTYPDLRDTTIRDWREVFTDRFGDFKWTHPPEQHIRASLADGTTIESEVIFLALDRPDDVTKLRGFQLSWAWMNEAKEQPKAIFDMLQARVGRYPRVMDGGCSYAGVMMDYNAPDTDDWLAVQMKQQREGLLPDHDYFVQPGAALLRGGKFVLNPHAENLVNLPKGYYQRLIGVDHKHDWILVNIANEFGFATDGKPVHPDFLETVHVASAPLKPTPNCRIMVGMDFGLTPAASFLQRQPDTALWVLDELVATDMDMEGFAPLLAQKVMELHGQAPGLEFDFVGDPSGDSRNEAVKQTVFTVLHRIAGIQARPARTNDPVLRRAALRRPMTRMVQGRPGFLISPKAKVTIKGLKGGFCYKRVQVRGQDKFRDEPDKNQYSHPVEACEYGALECGENASISATVNKAPTGGIIRLSSDWSPLD